MIDTKILDSIMAKYGSVAALDIATAHLEFTQAGGGKVNVDVPEGSTILIISSPREGGANE